MLRLYDYLPSQNAWKVRLLLNHLGLAYERVPVSIFEGESRTEAYLEKNPAGAVPVLEVEPGVHRRDRALILCYLAEARPTCGGPPRARAGDAVAVLRAELRRAADRQPALLDAHGETRQALGGHGRGQARLFAARARGAGAASRAGGSSRPSATPSRTWRSMPMRLTRTRRGSTSRPIRPSALGAPASRRSPGTASASVSPLLRSIPTRAASSVEKARTAKAPRRQDGCAHKCQIGLTHLQILATWRLGGSTLDVSRGRRARLSPSVRLW